MYHKHHSISRLLSVLCLVLQPKMKHVEAAVVSFTAGAEHFWCCVVFPGLHQPQIPGCRHLKRCETQQVL